MTNSACDRLAELYKGKAARGLVDVKFFVHGIDSVSKEVICDEVLRLEEAAQRGDTVPLDFEDRH